MGEGSEGDLISISGLGRRVGKGRKVGGMVQKEYKKNRGGGCEWLVKTMWKGKSRGKGRHTHWGRASGMLESYISRKRTDRGGRKRRKSGGGIENI